MHVNALGEGDRAGVRRLCLIGVGEAGLRDIRAVVGDARLQRAGIVRNRHHGMVHRGVVGHVGQITLPLHDGVLVRARLRVGEGVEVNTSVRAVGRGPDGLGPGKLLSRQVALVHIEGELAALGDDRRVVVLLHIALLRTEGQAGRGRLVGVGEGIRAGCARHDRLRIQCSVPAVRDRHRIGEGMAVIDHARLRARLLHDGVGEVLARGAVQVGELELAREADLAVCIVLRGVEHVAGSVLQVEGELAVRGLRRVVEAVRNLDGLGRRQGYGTLCVVGVVEGGSRSGTVIGDGHLRLVVVALVLLYLDVDLDFLGVVGHAVDGLAGFLLLERVVVLAQVQVLDGQLDLAAPVVGALGDLVAGLVVQAEGERVGRQVLAREDLRRLDGNVRRRLRVGEGRNVGLAVVGGGRL